MLFPSELEKTIPKIPLPISCSPEEIKNKTKKKLEECKKEIDSEFILSENDFESDFNGELEQSNIWNCWLVATINSMRFQKDFRSLIRKSVKKVSDGYEIIIPLGAPIWQGKVIKVILRDLYPQISVWGDELMSLRWKRWLKALIIAYGKISTGRDIFDIQKLSGWEEIKALNTIIYWISWYSRSRKIWNKDFTWNQDEDPAFLREISTALKAFDTSRFMTVGFAINPSWAIDNLVNFRKYPKYSFENMHAFTVKSVQYSWDNIIGVELVNPWNSKKPFTLEIKRFLQLVVDYSFASYNPRRFDLSLDSSNESHASRREYKDKEIPIQNQWISDLTGIRGEPILRNEKWKYYLLSYWISDTYLWTWFTQWIIDESIEKLHEWPWTFKEWRKSKIEVYLDSSMNNQDINDMSASAILSQQIAPIWRYKQWTIDYTIHFWKHTINFWKKNPFSDVYKWEKNTIFRLTLYPSFFSNYINQIY